MLNAIKSLGWASRNKSNGYGRIVGTPSAVTSHLVGAMQPSEENEERPNMVDFGHMLQCPLCANLYVHPLLLPCQHSLCYGCARAQLLHQTSSSSSSSVSAADLRITVTPCAAADDDDFTVETTEDGGGDQNLCQVLSPGAGIAHTRKRITSPPADDINHSTAMSRNLLLPNSPESPNSEESPRNRHGTRASGSSCDDVSGLDSPINVGVNRASIRRRKSSHVMRRSGSASSVTSTLPSLLTSPPSAFSHGQPLQKQYDHLKQSKVRTIFCPTCKSNVDLGKLGFNGLFRNFALETIVERFRRAAKAATAIRCGYCKPPASDATKCCLDCKLNFCNECYKGIHGWGTKRANHKYVAPTNNFVRPAVLLCPEHKHESLCLYCNNCNKPVCRKCKQTGATHANHRTSQAAAAYKLSREKLCARIEILKSKRDAVEERIDNFNLLLNDFETEEADRRVSVNRRYDELHQSLERRRKAVLLEIEDSRKWKESEARDEIARCRDSIARSSVISFADEILKETEPSYFLQVVNMINPRVQDAIDELTLAAGDPPNRIASIENTMPTYLREIPLQPAHQFRLVVVSTDNCDVILDNDAARAKISVMNPGTSSVAILRGNEALSFDSNQWRISLKSRGYVTIGVSESLCDASSGDNDDVLHGADVDRQVAICREGSFVEIAPSRARPCSTKNSPNKDDQRNVGLVRCEIAVHLTREDDAGSVHFYDVTNYDVDDEHDVGPMSLIGEAVLLHTAKVRVASSLFPHISVSGNATIEIS